MLFTVTMRQNKDFQRLYRKGAFCSLGAALMYVFPNQLPYNRLGITAGKKVGNAVKRNRAKRIIRAAYAAVEPQLPIGLDIVIVARSSLPEKTSAYLAERFLQKGLPHMIGVRNGTITAQPKPAQTTKRQSS